MLERLVENWLTSVGELGYQVPFTQLLLAEGHRVLQGPVHHPFEHGKDIITVDRLGRLCGFQLKGPNEINDLQGLERHQGQIDALALAAISHPSLGAPRNADQVWVVTNGVLRPEVRDRLSRISEGNISRRLPPLRYVERDELISRFLKAHGRYMPSEPSDFTRLVELYANEGREQLPVGALFALLDQALGLTDKPKPGPVHAQRAIAATALLTAISIRGWEAAGNHLAVAQAWLIYGITILRIAEEQSLPRKRWEPSFNLSFSAARRALKELLREATEGEDLVVPHVADGALYGSRALLVCGYSAALFLSERIIGANELSRTAVRALLKRELKYLRVLGEAGAPLLFSIANALCILESASFGEALAEAYAASLLNRNQDGRTDALADPYHDIEEILAKSIGVEVDGGALDEKFDGRAYTSRVAVEWLARRLRRQAVSSLWYPYTGIESCEFITSTPTRMLVPTDKDGILAMSAAKRPGSWAELRLEALRLRKADLPSVLWRHPEIVPFVPLLLPHRFTPVVARSLDYLQSR